MCFGVSDLGGDIIRTKQSVGKNLGGWKAFTKSVGNGSKQVFNSARKFGQLSSRKCHLLHVILDHVHLDQLE